MGGSVTLSAQDKVELTELIVEFGYRVDNGLADTVHELFVDDGVMEINWAPPGAGAARGREELITWGKERGQDPRRVAHILTNMRFAAVDEHRSEGVSYTIVYKALEGQGDTVQPMVITKFRDTFVRDGANWRFAARRGELLFGSIR